MDNRDMEKINLAELENELERLRITDQERHNVILLLARLKDKGYKVYALTEFEGD